MPKLSGHHLKIIGGLSFFILLVGYLAFVILSRPIIGIDVELTPHGTVIVTKVEAGSWSEHKTRPGDTVLEADGADPRLLETIRKYNSIENVHSLVIEQSDLNGDRVTSRLEVKQELSAHELVFRLLIPGISLLLLFGFSVYVYRKKRNDRAALQLILFFLSIGLSYFSSTPSGMADPVGRVCLGASFAAVPVFFVHFMQVYLQRFKEPFLSRLVLKVMYACSGLVAIMMILDVALTQPIHPLETQTLLVFFVAANFLIVYKLISGFRKHRSGELHTLFKFALTAHTVAFLPFLLLNALPGLFGVTFISAELTAIFVYAIPVVYFYLFVTQRLFDIDFLLNRLFYYTALSLIPALLILGVMGLLIHQNKYSWIVWVQIFLAVYLMITLFLFVKELMDYRLRPYFMKDLQDFQGSIDRFSKRISKVMKRSDLEQILEREIGMILPIRNVSFLEITRENDQGLVRVKSDGRADPLVEQELQHSANGLSVGEMIRMHRGICLVVGNYGPARHILWIDDKTNYTSFNYAEKNWLKTIAHYSSIIYENLFLVEGLIENLEGEIKNRNTLAPPWVLRLIFTLSENERRRLASDLHDAALQDQLIWYRKLESLMLDYPMEHELIVQLDQIKEGLLDVIHQIRQTCNELRPPLLMEMGIVEALKQLIQQEQIRSDYTVELHTEPDAIEMDDVQILAVYRIVQELLRNADKHAKASHIKLTLESRGQRLYFNYKDDGRGLDLKDLKDSFSHMGISGIQERVRSLNGEIKFDSAPDQGFEVRLVLPLAARHDEGGYDDGAYITG
ncbi:sensor histidine kinase [Paenibacillus sp. HN-1]|uniref:sensor histidine kinase n=1 Tax=Paenibacillus TaxID=44249 RepID=UPI001CAA297F|nr:MULTISPECIES: sensor histidine kinase [Paenibacillus]MBY9077982.1 sensor histidine kinase [Paenibacillus sp. CGMCC 1.18879]MBY9083914.1 sensor histidine kinase [Paenibacillus sinensis]